MSQTEIAQPAKIPGLLESLFALADTADLHPREVVHALGAAVLTAGRASVTVISGPFVGRRGSAGTVRPARREPDHFCFYVCRE